MGLSSTGVAASLIPVLGNQVKGAVNLGRLMNSRAYQKKVEQIANYFATPNEMQSFTHNVSLEMTNHHSKYIIHPYTSTEDVVKGAIRTSKELLHNMKNTSFADSSKSILENAIDTCKRTSIISKRQNFENYDAKRIRPHVSGESLIISEIFYNNQLTKPDTTPLRTLRKSLDLDII